jgi:hypothetical protein
MDDTDDDEPTSRPSSAIERSASTSKFHEYDATASGSSAVEIEGYQESDESPSTSQVAMDQPSPHSDSNSSCTTLVTDESDREVNDDEL